MVEVLQSLLIDVSFHAIFPERLSREKRQPTLRAKRDRGNSI